MARCLERFSVPRFVGSFYVHALSGLGEAHFPKSGHEGSSRKCNRGGP